MQCLALCGPTADSLSILNSKAICSVVQALLRLWWDLEWCSGSLWSRTNKDYCRMIDVFDSVWKIYRIFHALPEYSIKKITKFSIPLVQPCLLTKNIVKIVFLTEKMQKQAVWLQFSNLLLVNLKCLKVRCLCVFPKLLSPDLSQLDASLPLPTDNFFSLKSTQKYQIWLSFCVCTKSLKRVLTYKDFFFLKFARLTTNYCFLQQLLFQISVLCWITFSLHLT